MATLYFLPFAYFLISFTFTSSEKVKKKNIWDTSKRYDKINDNTNTNNNSDNLLLCVIFTKAQTRTYIQNLYKKSNNFLFLKRRGKKSKYRVMSLHTQSPSLAQNCDLHIDCFGDSLLLFGPFRNGDPASFVRFENSLVIYLILQWSLLMYRSGVEEENLDLYFHQAKWWH